MLSVKTPRGTFDFFSDYVNLRSCGLSKLPIELKGKQFDTLDIGNNLTDGVANHIDKLPVWLCANEMLKGIIVPQYINPRAALCMIPFHLNLDCHIYKGWGCGERYPVSKLYDSMSSMTHINVIADRATEICVALHELPAYVTYIIIEEYFPPNSIRMWAKWELITAVKHFHDRRSNTTQQRDIASRIDSDSPVSQDATG